MKIFAAGIATESNTFVAVPTSLDDFTVWRGADTSPARIERSGLDLSEIWGSLATARGDDLVVSLNAWAQPGGVTVRTAYESLREEMLDDLRAAMPVDVVLLMLHGAMVADGYDDCEEDLIRRVRSIVGPEAVIGVEFDLHCQLSASKIECADLVITYKEYPHTDINDRARELFDLAVRAKLREIRPVMALFDCQMIGIYPTSRQPLRGFVDSMMKAEWRSGVLSVSFAHGFQFADVPHAGAKMLVITDGDQALAQQVVRELGLKVYGLRRQISFDSLSLPIDEALSKALAVRKNPVVVADQSDNTGAGAPGDATYALQWLLDHKAQDVAMAIFHDPEVVKIARKAGPGTTLPVRLGGKTGPLSGDPVDIEVTVLSTLENYVHSLPQQSGEPWSFPVGNVVALRHECIDIVVGSERCQCLCPSIFSDLGIDPARKRILVVKSMQHFYGAFAPIAGDIIYMDAPGTVHPDPQQISYRRLNTRGLYPWVDDPLGAVG